MLLKNIKFIILIFLFYQTPVNSKSVSFDDFNSKNLSRYFSGIVAYENKDNSSALNFFNSSKILLDQHDPFLKRYIYSLVLENKISQAINIIKSNKNKNNTDYFDAHLLLIIDYLKKNNLSGAYSHLIEMENLISDDRVDAAILESLKDYIFTFKEIKILKNKKNFGKLSSISEAFQRCYIQDDNTDAYFSKLINNPEIDYSRYIFFYLAYLIENDRIIEAKKITDDIHYINSTLLLSQGKSWIEKGNFDQFQKVFSCRNPNDIISEFLFLISNLYSSEDSFEKSNFYLNLSNFLNPKFIFNLSLVAENQYLNKEYKKARKTLKKLDNKNNIFYDWYRIKKEAQIIAKEVGNNESLNFINSEFKKIVSPNKKILFDMANFYKNFKKYDEAIIYYTQLIEIFDDNSEIKQDLLYRRGGTYERMKEYSKSDKDLQDSLKIDPDDAYVLNYLAYSWLERNFKIEEAIKMLETAYELESDDPYIIDSIGWAYYLTNDYKKAEKFLKRAVELMPDDSIVNDHYGDILWKLDRKIQARYFWRNVLKMEDVDEEMLNKINKKIIEGLKNS
jgi:tetratricopeptide (TPR) repeat protein|tara:strand:+ start:197 stop:1885 length:1689 start_codon:yes stop_codon:yes gene_type:complete